MFGSTFIDTAIGISFVFLLLSLIASTVNEIILSAMNMRGQELLRGLKTLLNDDDATGLVKSVYNHGQIYGLFQGEFDPKSNHLPSYIPAGNFAAALLDVVREKGGDAAPLQQDAAAIVAAIRQGAQKLAQDEFAAKVGKPLLSMIDAAGSDLTKVGKSVEAWYNSAMDRVSGWYKYRTQWNLFWIGLALAVALNAGTIRIVQVLSTSPTLRQSIVATAQSVKQPGTQNGSPTFQTEFQDLNDSMSQLKGIGIPLGWSGTCSKDAGPSCLPLSGWLQTLAGWILTAIAVSLGAPFWFDLLNKFMVVRSTVKPREKSHEEGAKD